VRSTSRIGKFYYLIKKKSSRIIRIRILW